jgi:thioredoxin-related protein
MFPLWLGAQSLQVEEPSAFRLLVFEGSDWCANCLRLDRQVLSDQAFLTFADSAGVSVQHVDFPQRKAQAPDIQARNRSLAERYQFDGTFPTVLLLDEAGEVLARWPYVRQSASECIAWLASHLTAQP